MKMNNETKIGLMVSLLFILLAIVTVKTGKINFSKSGQLVKVHFRNVDGVNLNSPVMFNGFEVGIVEDVAIIEGESETIIELLLWVNEKARLRTGAKAYIKNLGFMGEKYVGLISGDVGGAYLAPGSIIVGHEPPDFERLLSDGQKIATRLKSITQNIDERLTVNKGAIDETLANLNSTMKDLASLVENANERLGANKNIIDDTVGNLHSLSVNLEELSYDLKLNPWKIMYRGKEKGRSSSK